MKLSLSLHVLQFACTLFLGRRIFLLETNSSDEIASLKATIGLLQKSVEGSTTRTLQDVPFSKVGEDWVADRDALFIFQRGVIIGPKNPACAYGQSVLSVDGDWKGTAQGSNCPSGKGSVTFGVRNEASGVYSSVLGGFTNQAQGSAASVLGGGGNKAIGAYSIVLGGDTNTAMGMSTSIAGGLKNTCAGSYNSILGGYEQELIIAEGEPGEPGVISTFPESPFSCTKKMCSTKKNFKFRKNLTVKNKFCVKDQCE